MNFPGRPMESLLIEAESDTAIGRMLQKAGKLTPMHTEQILSVQKEQGIRFGEAAKNLGFVTEKDIQQVLAHQFNYDYLRPGQGSYARELFAAYQPFSARVEVMRSIRLQLQQQWFDKNKMLMVASANPKEGTSLFVANLGIVCSQLGAQTLIVDANLRHPRQHKLFNLPNRQGLSDILANRADPEIDARVECFHNLFLLPAGTPPPNPNELVSCAAFKELHQSLSSRFDMIFIDAPPFSDASDALAIAALTGGTLLICKKNKTRAVEVDFIRKQLKRAGSKIVSSVLLDYD